MRRFAWLILTLAFDFAHAEEAKLSLQLGHSFWLGSVAYSPDGRFILTGGWDRTAILWDASTGAELRRLVGHRGVVNAVAFSPDGTLAATASDDRTARLWNVATGQQLLTFTGHSNDICAIAYSPDGRTVLTGSRDGLAVLWDTTTGKPSRLFNHSKSIVWAVAFSPDGRSILTGDDKIARLWNVQSGAELHRFEGLASGVQCLAFSPDGRFIVMGGWDRTARLWDAATGTEVWRFTGVSGGIPGVAFSRDGRFVLIGSTDKTARLLDAGTGTEVRKFSGPTDEVTSVAFSPDGRSVLTGSKDYSARTWNAGTGKPELLLTGYAEWVMAVTFSPDGRFLVTAGRDRNAHLWDATTGAEVRSFVGHSDWIEAAAFSPDGRFLITGGSDKTARLWNVDNGAELRRFIGHSDAVRTVAFSSDGRQLLTGSPDNTARLWDAATGKEVKRFEGEYAAFSPDGHFVATSRARTTTTLWDAASGAEVRRFEIQGVNALTFSPDGRFLLTGDEGASVRLFDVQTGAEVRVLEGHANGITSVAFSPDGHSILASSRNQNVLLWDAATGVVRHQFIGHAESVFSSIFSPDGHVVLTGSADGTTRLWDAATGKWLTSLISYHDGGWAAIDPSGHYDAFDPDNAPGLHFLAADDVIELGQLKQRFYTPGLLGRILRGETLPVIAGSLKDVKLVPGIQVQPPAPGAMDATIHLTDRGGGIGKVIVKVNGREVAGAARGDSTELRVNLAGATLSPTGKNVIEVFAENGDGVIRSRGVVAEWRRETQEQTEKPKLYAVVVGVSSYDNANLALRYAAKDAVDFGHALELAADRLFGKERTEVTVLASGGASEPTKENIRQSFARVAKEARGDDLLVVYLAGHGVAARNEEDQYYYLTKEARSTDISDAALRAVSAISSSELKEWLSRTNMPLKQVVVLDTCAAGAAFGDMVKLAERRELSPDQIRAIELLKDSTGSWILMGSAADAVSYEANRYAQGLLTYALLQGMQGAALEDDRVEVSKLFGFAQRQVGDLAKGIGGIQRPVMSAPRGQTFPIGLLTPEDRMQIHLATLKPQLLRARVLDDNDLDSLQLDPILRAGLRAASLLVTRGEDRQDPQVVYLDSVVDEVPDALIPQIRYRVGGEKVQVRLRLLRNGKPVAERNLELPKGDARQLSAALLPVIISESGKVR